MGKTVQELLTGIQGPLSHQEFVRWAAYYNVKASKQKQAESRARMKRGNRRR